MTKRTTYLSPVAAYGALCAMLLSGAAGAATLTQQWDTGLNTTNFSMNHTFSQFDTSLGTLNSVTITLNGLVERDILFQNLSPNSGASLTVAAGAWSSQLNLTGPDGAALTAAGSNALISLSTKPYGGEGSATAVDNGNGTTTIAGTTFQNQHLGIVSGGPGPFTDIATYYKTSGLATQAETLTSGLGLFEGTSTFNTTTSLGYSATGGNNYTAFQTWADGNVRVSYNYTPVPIPAALWLLGSGLAGLAGLGARRQRSYAVSRTA